MKGWTNQQDVTKSHLLRHCLHHLLRHRRIAQAHHLLQIALRPVLRPVTVASARSLAMEQHRVLRDASSPITQRRWRSAKQCAASELFGLFFRGTSKLSQTSWQDAGNACMLNKSVRRSILMKRWERVRYGVHTCSWKIGGHNMEQCGSCPEGCNAADGPNECEAGCVFAFASAR